MLNPTLRTWTRASLLALLGLLFGGEALADTVGAISGFVTDEATRNEAYQRFEQEWNANVPYVWLARTDWMIASDKTVHGYLPALNGSIASVIPKTWIANLWIG